MRLSQIESKRRNRKKHIKNGLCGFCNKPLSLRSKYYCDYHLGYNVGYSAFKRRLERLLVGNQKIKEETKENGSA